MPNTTVLQPGDKVETWRGIHTVLEVYRDGKAVGGHIFKVTAEKPGFAWFIDYSSVIFDVLL